VKHIDEYRDAELCRRIADAIANVPLDRTVTLMEVCGTHTMSIARHGIKKLLPESVRLISGPGCPVCVTPTGYIDHAMALARRPDTTIATFGDMIRVPGSVSSLEREQARGADIRIVFSPLEMLAFAEQEPSREFIFLGIGFETTVPVVAGLILGAAERRIPNVSVLSAPKTMPPPMRALAGDPDVMVDGYICPAHVSTIIGTGLYEEIVRDFGISCVVAGFEPVDILHSIHLVTERIARDDPGVDLEYARIARSEGNLKAQALIERVFQPVDAEWRGLGVIADSGLEIRAEFERFDAAKRFVVSLDPAKKHTACRCGDVLRGVLAPPECPLYLTSCTPEHPIGPCMVSTEGTCAAVFKYERLIG
jgi:hydrogenase expression/formation protein HypD